MFLGKSVVLGKQLCYNGMIQGAKVSKAVVLAQKGF
jgi:hypothetical protein